MTSESANEQSETPHPIAGVDLRTLPIGPEEAYVLSRVDGRADAAEIAAVTGVEQERVEEVLTRLVSLGAVRLAPSEPPPRRVRNSEAPLDPRARDGREPRDSRISRPVLETRGFPAQQQVAAALYDPAELDEAADLDPDRKRHVLDLFYRLDQLDHYELLGVSQQADKKEIKAAYYELVKLYHPDRYFGKQLGTFKPKLEKTFQRLTEAHDALTRKKERDEYDRYLGTLRKNHARDRLLTDDSLFSAELERARRAIEEAAMLAERKSRASSSSAPPAASSRTDPPPAARALDPEERRRALARKLGVSPSQAARASTAPPPPAAPSREQVAEDLRRLYESRIKHARAEQIERYVTNAHQALAGGDAVGAANALRIAVQLAPDDARIAELLEAAQRKAEVETADSYLEQAAYEEKQSRWADAARSYERAARGKPSGRTLERAVHCLLAADGDSRKAVELGRQAVALAPDGVAQRVVLARAYLAAGLRQSAQGEFERAATLAPNDDTIKDWLKRLRRNEI